MSVQAYATGHRAFRLGCLDLGQQFSNLVNERLERMYYRTLLQKEYLESGLIGYQCIDDIGESARKATAAIAFTPSPMRIRSSVGAAIR